MRIGKLNVVSIDAKDKKKVEAPVLRGPTIQGQ